MYFNSSTINDLYCVIKDSASYWFIRISSDFAKCLLLHVEKFDGLQNDIDKTIASYYSPFPQLFYLGNNLSHSH